MRRSDAGAATLKERSAPGAAQIRRQTFRVDHGTSEAFGALTRVQVLDGVPPIGTFDLELVSPLSATLVVFDIAASPSEPTITVQTSADGLTYATAQAVSRNGYRVNAWLPTEKVRFLRIQITPTHPDTLGGTAYSFGITNFTAQSVEFHLRSELVLSGIFVHPRTATLRFLADDDPRITYYLSWDNISYKAVRPGDLIAVPGATTTIVNEVALDANTGQLAHALATNAYLPSLRVLDAEGNVLRLAPGLNTTVAQDRLAVSSEPRICVNGTQLHLRPLSTALNIGNTYSIAYQSGPAELIATLRVQLTTTDRSETPGVLPRVRSFSRASQALKII